MATTPLESPKFKAVYGAGSAEAAPGTALASGKVYVYTTGTTDEITIWSDVTKSSALSQPVTLDAAGEAEIWFSGTVDIKVVSSTDVQQYTLTGITEQYSATGDTATGTGDNLLGNGDFETLDGDGDPASWTLATLSGGTVAVDSTVGNAASGTYSLKFIATGSGGGTAESTNFAVTATSNYTVTHWFKADTAVNSYDVDIYWYQSDGTTASLTPSNSVESISTGAPSVYTFYRTASLTAPADAAFARILISGMGAGEAGNAWYDKFVVTTGDQYTYDGSGNPTIIDSNDNEIVIFGTTASAVNEITITNAATGGTVYVAGTGDDANVNIQVDSKGNGYALLKAKGGGGAQIESVSGNVVLDAGAAVDLDATTNCTIDAANVIITPVTKTTLAGADVDITATAFKIDGTEVTKTAAEINDSLEKSGGVMSGDLAILKTLPLCKLNSTSDNASYQFFDDGTQRGSVFWDRTVDVINVRQYHADGTTPMANIKLTVAGDVDVTTGTFKIGGVEPKDISETLTSKTISAGTYAGTQTGFTGDIDGDATGNAGTATNWDGNRTVTLTGDVTGATTNASGTKSIATSLADNSVGSVALKTNQITKGQMTITASARTIVPAGLWTYTAPSVTGVVKIQVKDGTDAWQQGGSHFRGGAVFSDGVTVAFNSTHTSDFTIYYNGLVQ